MKEKIKKYIDLIPREEMSMWQGLLKDQKEVLKNVFLCLDEKNIELSGNGDMRSIYKAVVVGLSTSQVMLCVQPNLHPTFCDEIRRMLLDGIPVEVIKPIVNEDISLDKLKKLEKEYYIGIHEKDKKAFIDSLFSDDKDAMEE